MSKKDHFIIVGRTSKAIAQGVIDTFGDGQRGEHGPLITRPGNVIQARLGTHGDGEATANIFVDGKLPDHPIEQQLATDDKNEIVERLMKSRVTIVASSSGPNTSSRALSLAFLASHLKNNLGVRKIKVVAPALPFMRSDRNFQKRSGEKILEEFNAVACKEFAQILKNAGVDAISGFEAHSRDGVKIYRRIFGEKNVSFIRMGAFFADAVRRDYPLVKEGAPLIIAGSPDGMNKAKDYGIARASSFANALYKGTCFEDFSQAEDFRNRPYMFGIHKERISSSETKIVDFHGDVAGRMCILVDDIIAGGSTILHAAEELKKRGAMTVIVIATHGVMVDGAIRKLAESPFIDYIKLTDTIPGILDKLDDSTKRHQKKIIVETIAPLVNAEIARGFDL